MTFLKKLIPGLAVLAVSLPTFAADAPKDKAAPVPEPKSFVSEKTGTFGGVKLKYKAIAEETYIKNEDQKPVASIFSVSYIREGEKDTRHRPVFFIFNGGPGSASLWLHLGLYGPERVVVPSDATDDGAAPYDITANPQSILDVADLVFIDPVGTGYSHAIGEGKGKDFWGIDKDAKSVAEFIRLWLVKHQRWNSPKFLSGESYGTTRAAALLNALQGGWTNISINGVVFISSILDFRTAIAEPGNDAPYISYLPTMAATAWYHGKVDKKGRTLEAYMDDVRAFANGEYATALRQGNRLTKAKFDEIAGKVAAYTGLSKQYVINANLRVHYMRYLKELMRNDGVTLGRLDSRYMGKDYDGTGATFDNDPSGYGINAAYTAAINQYLHQGLGVTFTRNYDVLSDKPGRNWTEKKPFYAAGYPNVAPYVGTAMRENKDLDVMVACGYYDFATPFFAAENTFNSNGIDTSRVSFSYYDAGHMMYVHEPSREKLLTNIRAFIKKTLGNK
ncbi:S10 family peptidase [Kordiimonas marina]|uniref:S10 family peptidase n=1 Tax=Kordiimonas marina TaxID=2872312 RepID=UPI001FF6EF8B|nr:peptidase S10 [Kordiimonas marina]MCJ9430177.1 peptidase S10 [Kordiimonas marina]